ncbi:hypothetical protein EVAR_41786_1 [Eumeta japonica]|uniref:Uncharacterized protein n=1 Tax=Eumeta variegata TaxID=151549 RepID=A0A4C1W092_EUMVA|nr:hypothetical protein EVAR_41786_1 [Eumeta japonica]
MFDRQSPCRSRGNNARRPQPAASDTTRPVARRRGAAEGGLESARMLQSCVPNQVKMRNTLRAEWYEDSYKCNFAVSAGAPDTTPLKYFCLSTKYRGGVHLPS